MQRNEKFHKSDKKIEALFFKDIFTFFVKTYYLCSKINDMVVTFEKQYLCDLYEKGKSNDKKYRFQPNIIEKYKERIDTLKKANKIEDLFLISSLNYEVMKGDKQGISSIRVNQKYRIEFTVDNIEMGNVLTVCNIQDLSNHYK